MLIIGSSSVKYKYNVYASADPHAGYGYLYNYEN